MRISEFTEKGLTVTWTLLLISYNSINLLKKSQYEPRFISAEEIINYAKDSLSFSNDPIIISIAILSINEEEELLFRLQQKSKEENCDFSIEYNKFRAMYVLKKLPDENEDFVQGILEITDIWNQFNFPNDAPKSYLEFKEYSKENYIKILKDNINWVQNELKKLK